MTEGRGRGAPGRGTAGARRVTRRRLEAGRVGRDGEAAAARYLESRGWNILDRGFRTRDGEIDLVAWDGTCLVFVEVKTRSGLGHGRPGESVGFRKQSRLLRAARVWLHRHGAHESTCRFDVIEVVPRPGRPDAVEHLVDAFREGFS